MSNKIIAQGAEAIITLRKRNGLDNNLSAAKGGNSERNLGGNTQAKYIVTKERISKGYRLPELDERIRKSRTKREAKILIKAKEVGANVPLVLNLDKKGIPRDKFNLEIEYIKGDKLSETLNSYKEDKQMQVMEQLGKQVAKLHSHDIIHGDLTTSNVILKTETIKNEEKNLGITKNSSDERERFNERSEELLNLTNEKVYIIDFGLGFISKRLEDAGVDLHLIKQALEAKHFQNHELLFNAFLKGYNLENKEKVLGRVKAIEKRGRYRH